MKKNRVSNNVPQKFRRLKQELSSWTRAGGKIVLSEIGRITKEPKTGKRGYRRTASAPGEAWAAQHADGLASTFTTKKEILKTIVGSAHWRAKALEQGIKFKNRKGGIDPRPLMPQVRTRTLPTLKNLLDECVARANQYKK